MTRKHWVGLGIVVTALAGGVALVCAPQSQPVHEATVDDFTLRYQLEQSIRIDRTRFQYVYRATLSNGGPPIDHVSIIVSSSTSSTQIADDQISFGAVFTGATLASVDTFSLVQERTSSFDPQVLRFAITPWNTVATPDAQGATVSIPRETTISSLVNDTLSAPTSSYVVSDEGKGQFPSVFFSRYPNPSHLSLPVFVSSQVHSQLPTDAVVTETSVDGLQGLRYESRELSSIETFVDLGDDVFVVAWGGWRGNDADPDLLFYDSLLNSLDF